MAKFTTFFIIVALLLFSTLTYASARPISTSVYPEEISVELMLGTASPWLGQSLVVFDVLFLVVGIPSIVFVRLAFIASLVALPFTMFATRGLDNVFVRVCYVSLKGVRS
ncbi:hypothetical protein F2Q68_00003818 [Brassica cretica]|uniref:Uncharacterized protein n=1 Tax=Brassica cretica TaxID=69181 RepID=A0A8S9JG79_BRACR|nr:hypothetical protein F2Q68_00003818 [Brassica cretica]